ncbi:MAG TPA: bifunctional riboflavin kinase/FAD synthetase [Oscillospiraceae bacterium]|nr:bifunctional riboflavin kinase/FAD synthetase [Oscillospiraceae bacterium]
MEIVHGIESFQLCHREQVYLALGNFDGVHCGHKAIISTTVALAREHHKKSAVLIFFPHPLSILKPGKSTKLLNTAADRIRMLGEAGIDYVIIHPFTPDFAAISPQQFVVDILHRQLSVAGVIVGYDYSFGSRGIGTPADLQRLAQDLGFSVQVVERISILDQPVSSTAIRQLLQQGKMEEANLMLGYPYFLRGTVIHGDGRGRTLGFPTANLQLPAEVILPANGVYLTQVKLKEVKYWALTNVGMRPTFKKDAVSVEVYLFDTEKNLYDQELFVSFLQKIREEMSFTDVAALVAQIQADVRQAKNLICDLPKQEQ